MPRRAIHVGLLGAVGWWLTCASAAADVTPLPPPQRLEPLLAALHDAQADERLAAVAALERCVDHDDQVVPALIRSLDDADPRVGVAAAHALARRAHSPVASASSRRRIGAALCEEACKGDGWTQGAAAYALRTLPDLAAPALPGLVELLASADDDAVLCAIPTLESLGAAALPAVSALLDVLDRPGSAGYLASHAVAAVGSGAAPAILARLAEPGPVQGRVRALRALRAIGPAAGPAAAPVLERLLEDAAAEVRQAAAEALARLGPELGAAALEPLWDRLRGATTPEDATCAALADLGYAAAPALPDLRAHRSPAAVEAARRIAAAVERRRAAGPQRR